MKESGLEKSLKVIKKQGEKMLAPVTNMFDKLIQGLMALVAGKIVISLFDWFQNPENNKKVQTVFRFLSDFWPSDCWWSSSVYAYDIWSCWICYHVGCFDYWIPTKVD